MVRAASWILCLVILPAAAAAQSPGWPAGGVPVASTLYDRMCPVICSDGAGGSITAYLQMSVTWAQALNPAGAAATGWDAIAGVRVAPDAPVAPYMEAAPRIVPDGAGGAFVIWHDQRTYGCQHSCWGEWMELFAVRVTRDGRVADGWPTAGMKIGSAMNYMLAYSGSHAGALEDFNTVVVPDGAGGVLVAWHERWYPEFSGAVQGIHAQRLAADGTLLWGPRGVLVAGAAGIQVMPAIAATGDGGAAIVWQDSRDDSTVFRVYGQRLSSEGTPLWGEGGRPVTHGAVRNETLPAIAGARGGRLVLGWQAGTSADSLVLLAQRIEDGEARWPADVALSGGPHAQGTLVAAEDAAGDAWFAWVDHRASDAGQIMAQRLEANGDRPCGWDAAGNAADLPSPDRRAWPQLVAGGSGDAYVAWCQGGLPRAVRMTACGERAGGWPAAGLPLSLSAWGGDQVTAVPDGEGGALIAWDEGTMPNGDNELVRVQRLSRAGVWNGNVAGMDPVPDSCVTTPRPRFEALRPNPGHASTARVTFVLPEDGPVRIELFDLTGRRAAARDAGVLGAGRHTIPLGLGSTPPGVYFVRVTQHGRSALARGVLMP